MPRRPTDRLPIEKAEEKRQARERKTELQRQSRARKRLTQLSQQVAESQPVGNGGNILQRPSQTVAIQSRPGPVLRGMTAPRRSQSPHGQQSDRSQPAVVQQSGNRRAGLLQPQQPVEGSSQNALSHDVPRPVASPVPRAPLIARPTAPQSAPLIAPRPVASRAPLALPTTLPIQLPTGPHIGPHIALRQVASRGLRTPYVDILPQILPHTEPRPVASRARRVPPTILPIIPPYIAPRIALRPVAGRALPSRAPQVAPYVSTSPLLALPIEARPVAGRSGQNHVPRPIGTGLVTDTAPQAQAQAQDLDEVPSNHTSKSLTDRLKAFSLQEPSRPRDDVPQQALSGPIEVDDDRSVYRSPANDQRVYISSDEELDDQSDAFDSWSSTPDRSLLGRAPPYKEPSSTPDRSSISTSDWSSISTSVEEYHQGLEEDERRPEEQQQEVEEGPGIVETSEEEWDQWRRTQVGVPVVRGGVQPPRSPVPLARGARLLRAGPPGRRVLLPLPPDEDFVLGADPDDVSLVDEDSEQEQPTGRQRQRSQASYSGDDEDDPGPRTMSTPLSRQQLHDCFQLTGCDCARSKPDRSRPVGDDPLSLRDFLRHRTADGRVMTPKIPDVLRLVASSGHLPTLDPLQVQATDWQLLLAGVRGDRPGDPPALSLEDSDVSSDIPGIDSNVVLTRWWDIDAIILPLQSLAAHRSGIQIFYCPRFTKTITADWHTRITRSNITPNNCKHIRLFRGNGATGFDTFLFFPGRPVPRTRKASADAIRRRCFINRTDQRFLVDKVLLPSIYSIYPKRILKHHPRSYDEAYDRSHIRQKENVAAGDRSTSDLGYDLPSYTDVARDEGDADRLPLEDLWDAILVRLRQSPDETWHQAELITVTYGCKSRYYSRSLPTLKARLASEMAVQFDLRYVDLLGSFVDLAFEDEAIETITNTQLFVVHRTTCLQAEAKALDVTAESFYWHGTWEASGARLTPNMKSPIRAGGLAFIQSYHTSKDIFAPVDRSAPLPFVEPLYRSLSFTQAVLDEATKSTRSANARAPQRSRILHSLKACITRLHHAIGACEKRGTGFNARKEFRLSWDLYDQVDDTISQPVQLTHSADDMRHWPYYILDQGEALRFIRMQINRWLYATCAVLSTCWSAPTNGRAASTLVEQHSASAMLSAIFDVLELTTNSGPVGRTSRLAKAVYYRTGEEPDEIEDPTGNEGDRRRVGLDLKQCLQDSNLLWLPRGLFSWGELRFDTSQVLHTAYASTFLHRYLQTAPGTALEQAFAVTLDRSIAQAVAASDPRDRRWMEPLWQSCLFRYVNWLLSQLGKVDQRHGQTRLPYLASDEVKPGERTGARGLSYGLIYRSTGGLPSISLCRGGGGNAAARGGFSDFDNNWETRIRLLFSWDDNFTRSNWDDQVWRQWTRRCYKAIANAVGVPLAREWIARIGLYGRPFLTILPLYEKDKMYQPVKRNVSNNSDRLNKAREAAGYVLRWVAAQPQRPYRTADPVGPRDVDWGILLQVSGFTSKNLLPAIRHDRPVLVEGTLFDLIPEVLLAAATTLEEEEEEEEGNGG